MFLFGSSGKPLALFAKAKRREAFTRGDWLLKAMLGPVSSKFDQWDEGKQSPSSSQGNKGLGFRFRV